MKKFLHPHFLLTGIVLCFLTSNAAAADPFATPDPRTEIFPNILINEVSFKDPASDWIELYIIDDMNAGAGANLKGLKVFDDNDFLIITEDVFVSTGDFIIINFKSETETFYQAPGLLTFNIKRSGLTGTTEQVVIKNNINEIIDAVCWANSTPTEREISDFNEIAELNQWTQNIFSCLPSEKISNYQSIARKNLIDTNSASDWKIESLTTKGLTNIIPPAAPAENPNTTSSATQTAPFVSGTYTADEEQETLTAASYSNQPAAPVNTCTSIIINEFLPNPAGTDTGNEWIELYNAGENCVMDGWIIDDIEGGSKPFYINNEQIVKNGFLLLPSWKTKISLNNNEDSVRLFSGPGVLVESVSYENAKENYSYARNSGNEFEWTSILTPLGTNLFINDIDETDDETSESSATSKTSNTTTSSKKTTSKTTKTIKNGDLSDNIFITEIFPNPKGTDKGNEWFELYNDSDEKINLGGWKIDLGEGTTKKYTFDNTAISAYEFIVLSDTETGITLKNTNGVLRLLDYEETVIDNIEYGTAPEASSYSRIKISSQYEDEYEWKWTSNTTKGEENEVLYKYYGVIISTDEKTGVLEFKQNGSEEIIIINFVQPGGNMFAAELKKSSEAELLLSKNDKEEYLLEDFKILKEAAENDASENQGLIYIILSSLPPAGLLGYYGIKKLGLIKLISA